MLSEYKVQIVKSHETVSVPADDLGIFFILTTSSDLLDEDGYIRTPLFLKAVGHTYRDFYEAIAEKYAGLTFDVVTYLEKRGEVRLNSKEVAMMATQLIQNLWGDGYMNGASLVISMGTLQNQATGESHHILIGFTFRSDESMVYLMEGDNRVKAF